MFFPDLETIELWAEWDFTRVPHYVLYSFTTYVPAPVNRFLFKERKTGRMIAKTQQELLSDLATGKFRPFVIVPSTDSPSFPPGGSDADLRLSLR